MGASLVLVTKEPACTPWGSLGSCSIYYVCQPIFVHVTVICQFLLFIPLFRRLRSTAHFIGFLQLRTLCGTKSVCLSRSARHIVELCMRSTVLMLRRLCAMKSMRGTVHIQQQRSALPQKARNVTNSS